MAGKRATGEDNVTASLLLGAMRVLNVELKADEEGALVWNSPGVFLSPAFIQHLKPHINDLRGLLKLRCRTCNRDSVCEEGEKYFYSYCPNCRAYIRREAKEGFTLEEAQAEYRQICFELEERIALMTEDGRDENEAINVLCEAVITDLFMEKA